MQSCIGEVLTDRQAIKVEKGCRPLALMQEYLFQDINDSVSATG